MYLCSELDAAMNSHAQWLYNEGQYVNLVGCSFMPLQCTHKFLISNIN